MTGAALRKLQKTTLRKYIFKENILRECKTPMGI